MPYLLRLALSCWLASVALPALADDGDPDTAFSADGKATFAWPANYAQAATTAVATFPDGAVIAAGWVDNGNDNRDFAVLRFTHTGAVDATFGNQGSVVVPFDVVPGGDDRAAGVFVQSDGKVLVVGSAGTGTAPYVFPAVLRLQPDGQPDPGFGSGGKRVINSHPFGAGASFQITKALQQPDGKMLLAGICGNCGNGGPPDFLLLRLLPDGSPDTGFANQGWFNAGRVDGSFWVDETLTSLALDSAGRILLAGYQELPNDPDERRVPLVVCVGANGVRETSFGDDGFATLNLLGSWQIDAIVERKRYLGSGFTQRRIFIAVNLDADNSQTPASLLAALGIDGAPLTTFGTNGFTDLTRDEGTKVIALAARPDDTITAAGWIDRVGAAEYDFFIARTLFDGTLDTSFDGNGVRSVPFDLTTNSYDRPTAMTLSAQRPVIVGNVENLFGPEPWNTGVLRMKSDLIFADTNR